MPVTEAAQSIALRYEPFSAPRAFRSAWHESQFARVRAGSAGPSSQVPPPATDRPFRLTICFEATSYRPHWLPLWPAWAAQFPPSQIARAWQLLCMTGNVPWHG